MLTLLLEEIKKGGPMEISQLARKFHTTAGLVLVMLEELQHMGMLSQPNSCGNACRGCALSKMCGEKKAASELRLWQFESTNSEKEKLPG